MEYKGYYDLNGSYKLSETLILRLVTGETDNRSSWSSISNYELLTVLHFSHICDRKGFIENFKTLDLCRITGCSRRAAYHIINNLCEKGFLTASGSDWYGRRNLVLLNNDYTDFEPGKRRYLNTNFTFLNYRHPDHSRFKKLTLNAKKLLLYLLFQYSSKYGYRVSLDSLLSVMNLQKKSRILSYIDELKTMFDQSFFLVKGSRDLRLKYATLQLPAANPFFSPREGIRPNQDTHFHYIMRNFIIRHNITTRSLLHSAEQFDESVHSLYALTVRYLKEQISYAEIESSIRFLLQQNGVLDEVTILHINQYLMEKHPTKSG